MNVQLRMKSDVTKPSAGVSERAFQILSVGFRRERDLLNATAGELRESFNTGLAVLALDVEHGNRPVGYTRLHHLLTPFHELGQWFELGSTYVDPRYRKGGLYHTRGICGDMYAQILAAHKDSNILMTTTNPRMYEIGETFDFVLVSRKRLPEALWRSTCICPAKKTGARDNANCKLAWAEEQQLGLVCWVRVTPETADRNGLRDSESP